jgi:hypothetical protein
MTSREPLNEQYYEQVATSLVRRGLRGPAVFVLEAARPFAFIGGQLLWVLQPLLSLAYPKEGLGRAARLLEEPAAVNSLIARLERHKGP